MDLLILVAVIVSVIAVLVAVMTWSRRGQSSIGRESGYTVYQTRRKEQAKGTWTGPGI
jgi:EamA domain-containing membrane protein RarD